MGYVILGPKGATNQLCNQFLTCIKPNISKLVFYKKTFQDFKELRILDSTESVVSRASWLTTWIRSYVKQCCASDLSRWRWSHFQHHTMSFQHYRTHHCSCIFMLLEKNLNSPVMVTENFIHDGTIIGSASTTNDLGMILEKAWIITLETQYIGEPQSPLQRGVMMHLGRMSWMWNNVELLD